MPTRYVRDLDVLGQYCLLRSMIKKAPPRCEARRFEASASLHVRRSELHGGARLGGASHEARVERLAQVQVDFDDETSWEYLFKVYWVILKQDLSLTLDELTQAKKPWKGVATVGYKPLLINNVIPNAVSVKVPISYSSTEHLELNKPHLETSLLLSDGLTTNNHVEKLNNENGEDGPRPNKDAAKPSMDEVKQETIMDKSSDDPGIEKCQDDPTATITGTEKRCICKHLNDKESKKPEICLSTTEWATKDLLEFVAHMKNGDTSAILQSDVQTLLLDYINSNNLWNPRRKSQIICDPRLKKLFGKPRVGHIQMLKLLGFHFLIKEESRKNSFIPAGFVSSVKTDDDNSKKDECWKPNCSGFSQNGEKPISPNKEDKEEKVVQARNETKEKTDAGESSSSDNQMSKVNITNLATDGINDQDMQRSGLEISTATAALVGNSPSSNIMEIEKLWHYRDSDGKIRGPFSMMQLREWSTTGLYPPDMRIWTNHEQYDSLPLTEAMHGKFHGASDLSNSGSREEGPTGDIGPISEGTDVSGEESKKIDTPNNVTVLSENDTGVVRADESGSWPECWDFLKDNNNSSANDDVQAHNLLHPPSPEKKHEALPHCGQESDKLYHGLQIGENNSTGLTATQIPLTAQNKSNNEDQAGPSSEEKLRSLNIDLSSHDMGLSNNNQVENISVLDFPSPTAEDRPPVLSDVPVQNSGILELLSPTPRSNNEDQGGEAIETKNSGFINFPVPNSGNVWTGASGLGVGGVQIPDLADEWCKFSPTDTKASVQEWSSALASAFSLKPPEITCESIATSHPTPNLPNWLANINEPIEFDALGEESVSDLLAEVDAMESQGALQSPTSAIKFARELLEDCKDDCFSSIEEFSSVPDPRKGDALSSTSETQLNPPCKPIGPSAINAFNSLTRSNAHSSASSEGETNAASEFHLPAAPNATQDMIGAAMGPGMGSDSVDPGWGTVQGNINLVTVQGNVNLVLGGPGQGMANLGWGANPGPGWVNPANLNLPWDGQQRKYSSERFTSPREWGGYQGGRPPWGRQLAYGGGGYTRPIPKGQRVCKFYESGHCKKGAFCDYLHP
ncbi:zinc finger CCCH domain-containing protein 44 [Phtheirospermum japonicum]|uniref:Zinc finger CCCH domain-containing protein 44 n=1 Tax=Phtheirospermum japonicum TaxID=374723 RepID=A0A830BB36_9LAMI|nr:zinc finger CCCH domain-containing protein 44 [Phtheirospermum japonicum]